MATLNGSRNQSGFTIIELMIVLTIMIILSASIFGMMRNSMMISLTTYEMTAAQENVRTAHEYLSRDLLVAGDGTRGLGNICVRANFVFGFLTRNPGSNPCGVNMVNLPLIQSDDNVPANTAVPLTNPAKTVRYLDVKNQPLPELPDRINILQKDTSFTTVTLNPNLISADGGLVSVPLADVNRFNVGEVYFFTSQRGATFATVTARNSAAGILSFATGDVYGLNQAVDGGPLSWLSDRGRLATSIQRMLVINYFVDQDGLLIRRVIGLPSTIQPTDSIIAERIMLLKFRYLLNLNGAGNVIQQPADQLATVNQQSALRQVEVTVTSETARELADKKRQQISMTTTTSVRNLQFREVRQP